MKTSLQIILKSSWPYGLGLALISVVISLLIYIFDVNMFSITFAIFSFLIILIGIPVTISVLGCNNLRVKFAPERKISYFDAVATCFVLLIIGFLISNLYSYIFYNFLDPSYMKGQIAKLVEMLDKYNVPQEEIDKTIARSEKNFQIGRMLLTSFIVSAVLSLIVSIFVRKKDKLDENMM